MEKHQHITHDGSATLTSAHTPGPTPTHIAPTHEPKRDYSYYKAVFKGHPMPFAYLDLWRSAMRTAQELAALYPRWYDFQRIRMELDPQGMFLNDYLRKLFDADSPVPNEASTSTAINDNTGIEGDVRERDLT